MTDLLLSGLLTLLILLPVLLRPFSKHLQKGRAIPILPFISLFVCICTIIGQDIVLFLAVLLVFVLIVCLSEIIRLTEFFQGVLNDFYGITSIMLRIILLLLFCGMVYAAFRFAPEAYIKTEHPLVVRSIDLVNTPKQLQQQRQYFEGRLIERQGGADKKALVIVTETYPASAYPGTLAAVLADQGYTVAELYTAPHYMLSRIDLYARLFHLIGKKEARYLAKVKDPHISSAFSDSIETILGRYGNNKRLFLYTEGIYTGLAEQFCANHQGSFTGVFFNISSEEPLPAIPEDRMQTVYTDTESSAAGTNPSAAAPALQFYCRVSPYHTLTGFGSLRADDIVAAELLGSGRSIGRKDKAAAAAAFQRYALSL